jgi:hypothetical protein
MRLAHEIQQRALMKEAFLLAAQSRERYKLAKG